ncbi:pleiotropic regulatory protein [Geomicrobium sp. JCM 19037]|uniref:DegT/DnrJ/EryC1/StrS family aminotransferase n=1 Tax=Geomicrobium sp. JCM 19037 TaxID=1460634 RepID=UPI00045F4368|nr:DegT/DnrJ/EryC1/StrS family aminotransferase [Geomicrobium sp. JCM 19037]GAK03677.1 pleiotropic regulatory protein [Geomicrobium sp. JCM 19037]
MIPMVDLKKEYELLKHALHKEVQEVMESGVYILGPKCEQLEREMEQYHPVKYAVGVANGTDALYLAVKALGIGAGDEIITTPFTFFASGEAIEEAGATPVFVDINPLTYNMDTTQIEAKITPKTRAILVVHLFGKLCDMDVIMSIAKKHNLRVIEDACQAIGTKDDYGKKAGTIGDVGCFSFFPSKNLGGFGDGGMVITNDQDVYDRVLELRNHGSVRKYEHRSIGINSRLDELQAAVLLVKLQHLDLFLHKRTVIAKRYSEELKRYATVPDPYLHSFHQYCFEVKDRKSLMDYLAKRGISSAVYYPIPLHLQEALQHLRYKKGDFPLAERAAEQIIALPISPELAFSDQEYIIQTIHAYYK